MRSSVRSRLAPPERRIARLSAGWPVLISACPAIKFRPGASSPARVIHHRKEEMHPVGFGRRRSVALARKGSRVGSGSSVFSQWASLTASLPGVFEANWSLSISPESCRLSGWAYASKKIEPNGSLRMKGGRRAERWASIMRAIKCLKSIRWMPWR